MAPESDTHDRVPDERPRSGQPVQAHAETIRDGFRALMDVLTDSVSDDAVALEAFLNEWFDHDEVGIHVGKEFVHVTYHHPRNVIPEPAVDAEFVIVTEDDPGFEESRVCAGGVADVLYAEGKGPGISLTQEVRVGEELQEELERVSEIN